MLPLISFVLVILGALGLKRLFPVIRNIRTRRRQVRFIRETLANGRRSNDRRVIASLSTVPDRIGNLEPTIRSLLNQTRRRMRSSWPFRNFRFGSGGLMSCRNIFRSCRACVFCVAARIGGQQRSLSPSFEKSWRLAGEIH